MKRRRETIKERIEAIIAPLCDSTNARLLTQRQTYAAGGTVVLTASVEAVTVWQEDGILFMRRAPRGFETYEYDTARIAVASLSRQSARSERTEGTPTNV